MSDQKPPEHDPNANPLDQEQLEAIFRDWDASRQERSSEDDDSQSVQRSEQLQEIQRIHTRAQGAVAKRLLLMLSMFLVSGITFVWNYSEIQYYFKDKRELGDVRAQYMEANQPNATPSTTFAPEIQHNDWLSLQNLIPTEEYQSEDGHWQYFFDPMLKMIVMTPKPLPKKAWRMGGIERRGQYHAVEVKPGLLNLVTGNGSRPWMYPEEAAMTGGFFSGEGRVFEAGLAPRKYRGIINMYRADLLLDSRLEDQKLWIFVHEENPANQWRYLIMYIIALLLILASGVFYVRAKRKLRETAQEFASVQMM